MRHQKSKRGQAALEFLTTYGWAFLVILVMIGALAYFGVLDPTRFLPQRCQFGAELHCERFSMDGNSQLASFELTNALPEDIFVDAVEYKTPDEETFNSCGAGAGLGIEISRETKKTLECDMTGTNPVDSGEKQRVQFKIVYSQGGGSYNSTFANDLFGEIYANVR